MLPVHCCGTSLHCGCGAKHLMMIAQRVKAICIKIGAGCRRGRAAWGSTCEGPFLAKARGGGRLKVMGGRKTIASATGRLLWCRWVRQLTCWLLRGINSNCSSLSSKNHCTYHISKAVWVSADKPHSTDKFIDIEKVWMHRHSNLP